MSSEPHTPLRREMLHLGAVGLLARCAVHLSETPEAKEHRELIEACLQDHQDAEILRYRRVLNRMEVEPWE